jgi:hypothetical protein
MTPMSPMPDVVMTKRKRSPHGGGSVSDVAELLDDLRKIGAQVTATGRNIVLRAGTSGIPADLVIRVRQSKPALLTWLSQHAAEVESTVIPPASAAIQRSPLLEPSSERRGRIVQEGGGWLHFCDECGRWGGFGCGVDLRTRRLGRWYCAEHRPKQSKGDDRKQVFDARSSPERS